MKHLYIFLDEGGNFDFSPKGTKFFTLTAVTKERPFEAFKDLSNLKYDWVEQGVELEYFHASEDRQQVRNGDDDLSLKNDRLGYSFQRKPAWAFITEAAPLNS